MIDLLAETNTKLIKIQVNKMNNISLCYHAGVISQSLVNKNNGDDLGKTYLHDNNDVVIHHIDTSSDVNPQINRNAS